MKKILFNKFNVLFRNLGFQISPLTNNENLRHFFSTIHPITTNHKLIRIGKDDGGYLIPDDLVGINACFSPGVSSIADFENDLTKRGIKCFLADYSVDKPPIENDLFSFTKKYLGNKNDEIYTTLEKWIENSIPNNKFDLILQMDIESSEYDVLLETPYDTLNQFRIIIIEFHNLHNFLLDRFAFKTIENTFIKLLRNFSILHIHPNNYFLPVRHKEFEIPPFMEFTFLRKDRITESIPTSHFPHKLDRKNTDRNKDFVLPKCWYE